MHKCSHPYHYGDHKLVRDCCVDVARRYKAMSLRNAITDQHPAYGGFTAAWNALTDAERWIVGDLMPVYDHGPAGFTERPMQTELAL